MEFKRLSDVEVVAEPTEAANVLIEENGVIKKAPKTAVGGAGGSEPDMVIALNAPFNYDTATSNNTTVAIESGSLEAVAEALRAGRAPVVKCKRYYLTNPFNTSFPVAEGGVYDCNVFYYGGYIHFSFAVSFEYTVRIVMNIDDSEYLELWLYPQAFTTVQVI